MLLLTEGTMEVDMKPSFEEQPPLVVSPSESEYCLRQKKSIRKNTKGLNGTLIGQVPSPKPSCLHTS
jgi:hypothetical protein